MKSHGDANEKAEQRINATAFKQMNHSMIQFSNHIDETKQVGAAFSHLMKAIQEMQSQLTHLETIVNSAEKDTTNISTSTSELVSIITVSSSGLEEMSTTVEELTKENNYIKVTSFSERSYFLKYRLTAMFLRKKSFDLFSLPAFETA